MKFKKRVLAAMSGGVDSSVAALLLKEAGFEVIGVTYQIWGPAAPGEGCCGLESTETARLSADKIGINHYVLNLRELFRKKIIDSFCEEYIGGRTPNPCVECNRSIKFEALTAKAAELGADYMATGHYARIEKAEKTWLLKKGIDETKDQSYFLYTITQDQLQKILMPLGNHKKTEVRRKAKDAGLPAAERPESQEICFIPDNDYRKFLSERMPERIKPGKIIDRQGQVIGTHAGTAFYTIGQRRGLNIKGGKPYFVSGIEGDTIIAGESEDIYSKECLVGEVNLITGKIPSDGRIQAKIRHPGQPRPAKITMTGIREARIEFDDPKWAVTPGQSAVFYRDDTVIGGGIISG